MTDQGITFNWFGIPCHCRCRHCLLHFGGKATSVAYFTARAIVERFLLWRGQSGQRPLAVDFSVGYPCVFAQLDDYLKFRRDNQMPGAEFLALNGTALLPAPQLEQMLASLSAGGIRQVGISFYGLGQSHDAFAARKGDMDYMLRVAKAASALGLERVETIFLRQGHLEELPELVDRLDSIHGLAARYLTPWDYRGKGKLLESERPDASEIDLLPPSLRRCFNPRAYRTEQSWCEAIAKGSVAEPSKRFFFLSIAESNSEALLHEPCERVIEALRQRDDQYHSRLPALFRLAQSYGDKHSQVIYTLRDLEWKWQDRYLQEHSEVSRDGCHDDTGSGALRK